MTWLLIHFQQHQLDLLWQSKLGTYIKELSIYNIPLSFSSPILMDILHDTGSTPFSTCFDGDGDRDEQSRRLASRPL